MGGRKTEYKEDEIAIFEDACVYKRGDYWQFRLWLEKEKKYVRKSLRTRKRTEAVELGKELYQDLRRTKIWEATMPTRSSPILQSYSEFLASSFGNFTQTYFADHSELWSHDQINRQLRSQKWTPRSLRQYLRNQIQFSHQGYLLFDDTVLDKRHSHFIEMVRR